MVARLIAMATGAWLMAAPSVLGYSDPAATNDRVFGPTAAAIAVIAMAQVTRELRWINGAIGVWLVLAPWVLDYGTAALINSTACGLVLAGLSTIRGRVDKRYGGGWSSLVKKDAP